MNGLNLYEVIKKIDWEFGASNIDDDFHTDILFLRTACSSIYDLIGIKHDDALIIYEGYKGTFYFSHQKTIEICEVLINKLIHDDLFRDELNEKIIEKSQDLWNVYNDFYDCESLIKRSDSELKDLYKKQLQAHLELYKYGWIPEVLQVDHIGLTDYLLNYLRMNLKIKEEEIDDVFIKLTTPIKKSVYFEEENLLRQIAEKINQIYGESIPPIKYLRTYLTEDVTINLNLLYEKYSFLSYHGFGSRKRTSKFEYLERAVELSKNIKNQIMKNEDQFQLKIKLYEKYQIPDNIRKLFELYSDFAVSKSHRRLSELKNFYYLDQIIEIEAKRKNIPECYLRFLTPDEFVQFFDHQLYLTTEIKSRCEGMVYFYHNGNEHLSLDDPNVLELLLNINKVVNDGTKIKGKPTCFGMAEGRAKLIIRKDECIDFSDGDIIVSTEGDPDLIPLIKKAGAIITDQAGVTSHISIIAREFNIPCITGCKIATKVISNNDYLIVDAHTGVIEIRRGEKI